MKLKTTFLAAAAMLAPALLNAQDAPAADAAHPIAATSSAALVASAQVVGFYQRFQTSEIWTSDPQAVSEVIKVLRRAPVDGFQAGPQYAAQIEAQAAQMATMTPEQRAEFDKLISTAWVGYVQKIKAPVPGMIYGDAYAAPVGSQTHEILLTAQAAPSRAIYIHEAASVNYFYDRIRAAVLADMQARGLQSPDARALANLERARPMPGGGRYVLVDAATQTLYMMENGQPVDHMKVIVGTDQYPTPMIASTIYYATHNPYWNVPDHLVRQTVGKRIVSEGTGYTKPRGYELMSDWTNDAVVMQLNSVNWNEVVSGKRTVRVRQRPGPGNSMGKVKFNFPNGEGIFLHDTPSKHLFAKASRDLSNGCIRLEDAFRLGEWLMKGPAVAPSKEPETHVALPEPVRVYVTYLTAQPSAADAEGHTQLSYVKDIYSIDPAA
ncbi:MAG TPA: L,D-transpeptidase family protein [Alteraurantiacibacter sp.]|jgi:murein L,D-transpeptidase YcbB/YkuD